VTEVDDTNRGSPEEIEHGNSTALSTTSRKRGRKF